MAKFNWRDVNLVCIGLNFAFAADAVFDGSAFICFINMVAVAVNVWSVCTPVQGEA